MIAPLSAFPFSVGRAAGSALRVEAPGVWDRHLQFELEPREGLFVVAHDGALVRYKGETITRQRVKNGDEFEMGGAVLRVGIGTVRRRRLGFWEWVVWGLLLAAVVTQVVLALWLLEEPVP